MQYFLRQLWSRWILSTFMTGALALLPIVMTVVIMGWVGNTLVGLLGPWTFIGGVLRAIGLQFVTNSTVATVMG